MKCKKGLWEEGKRIMWFEDQAKIEQIQNGEVDFREHFQSLQNQERPILSKFSSKFVPPPDLDLRLKRVDEEI